MIASTTSGIAALIIGLTALVGALFLQMNEEQALGGLTDSKCIVSTSTAMVVGDDTSTQLLGNEPNRAWARVQQLEGSSNSIWINLDEANAAVVGTGIVLAKSSSTTNDSFMFGKNTDMPYTGEVTAITDTSSTSVLVVDCLY